MSKDKKRAKLVAALKGADKVLCDADKAWCDAYKARDDAEIALHDYDKSKDL